MAKLLTQTNPLKLREEDEIGGGGEAYTPLELFNMYVDRKYKVGDEDNETLQYALDVIRKELAEKQKQDEIFAAIKRNPRIFHDSVRFDSVHGVHCMLGVSLEMAQDIKDTYRKIKEYINE